MKCVSFASSKNIISRDTKDLNKGELRINRGGLSTKWNQKNFSWLRCAKFFIWKEVTWFFEQVKAEKKSKFFLSQFYRRSRRIVNGPCFPLSFSPFRIEREVDRSSRIASFPGSNRSTSSRVRLSKPVQRSRFLFFETTKRYHPDRGKY